MNKSIIRVALVLSIVGCGMLKAASSEFRSPLSLNTTAQRGFMHYPLSYVHEAWWYDDIPSDREENKWQLFSWKGAYYRSANKSFFDDCNPCRNKTTRNKVSLSTLFFGKEDFRGEEAFAGGILENTPGNILLDRENLSLGYSRISPRFDYNEYGAYFGVDVSRKFGEEGNWRVGARASIPFKVIEIEQDQKCGEIFETLDDVLQFRLINVGAGAGANHRDFAARLDFLMALVDPPRLPARPNESPFVTQDNAPLQTFMSETLVSGVTKDNAQVYLLGVNDDRCTAKCGPDIPDYPFRKAANAITANPLPANGAAAGEGSISFFLEGTDYRDDLFKNRDAQGKLFVVPRRDNVADQLLNGGSNAVSQRLFRLVETLQMGGVSSPLDYFCKNGVDLCAAERITGQGDLDTEIYGGYEKEDWFVNGIVGFKIPTASRDKDSSRVFFKSTGNNGHFEAKVGVEGGWQVWDWFAFKADAAYHHAFKRTESRAAPFKGATVRNIGPCVDAKISWGYFTGHIDLNFFHPYNPEIGCTFGYELFAKRKDKVCIDCTKVKDFLGREQEIDSNILREYTNSMTHKVRGEFFHRWNFFELFAGGSHVLAGKNAMQETEAYVGVTVYF